MKTATHGRYFSFSRGLVVLAATSLVSLSAAEDDNWYFTVIGGNSTPSDTEYLSSVGGDTLRFDTEFSGGVLFGGNIGYEFNDKWSGEFEYIWQRSEADEFGIASYPDGGEGDVASVTMMFNGVRNWQLGEQSGWFAFAGAGIGLVQEVSSDYELEGVEYSFDDDGFGFQAFVGVRKNLGEKWYWTAKVNQLWGGSYDLIDEVNGTDSIEMDYDVTSLQLGLGFRF